VSLRTTRLSAAAAEETTLQTIVVAVSGKKQRRQLQSERSRKDGVSTRLPAPKSAPAKPSSEQEKLDSGWNHVGVTLDNKLTWSAQVNQVGKKAAQRLGMLGPFLNRRSGLSRQKRRAALQAAHPSYDALRMSDLEVRCP
jgi:hypothetical protein